MLVSQWLALPAIAHRDIARGAGRQPRAPQNLMPAGTNKLANDPHQ